MHIRVGTAEDCEAINRIYNHAVLNLTCTADLEPWTLEKRLEWLRNSTRVLVADDDGVVGWSGLRPYKDRPGYRLTLESSVYIDERCVGRGIGRALMLPLIEWAEAAGYRSIMAGIDAGNQPSIRLHERLGFRHAGRLTDAVHKFGRFQDVVLMQRMLEG